MRKETRPGYIGLDTASTAATLRALPLGAGPRTALIVAVTTGPFISTSALTATVITGIRAALEVAATIDPVLPTVTLAVVAGIRAALIVLLAGGPKRSAARRLCITRATETEYACHTPQSTDEDCFNGLPTGRINGEISSQLVKIACAHIPSSSRT